MDFLSKYLWTIYEMMKEECNDGDNFSPDLTNGLALFVAALEGRKDTDYACMKGIDKEAALKEWEEKYPEIKERYDTLLLRDGPALRRKELSKAFQAGDKEAFNQIISE